MSPPRHEARPPSSTPAPVIPWEFPFKSGGVPRALPPAAESCSSGVWPRRGDRQSARTHPGQQQLSPAQTTDSTQHPAQSSTQQQQQQQPRRSTRVTYNRDRFTPEAYTAQKQRDAEAKQQQALLTSDTQADPVTPVTRAQALSTPQRQSAPRHQQRLVGRSVLNKNILCRSVGKLSIK